MPSQDLQFPTNVDVTLNVTTKVVPPDTVANWGLRFVLQDEAGNTVIDMAVGTGIEIVDAKSYRVNLTGGPSAGLAPGRYRYSVRATSSPKRTRDVWGYYEVSDWP